MIWATKATPGLSEMVVDDGLPSVDLRFATKVVKIFVDKTQGLKYISHNTDVA